MLDVFFFLTARPDVEPRMRALLLEMTQVSRQHDGCLHYAFHQQLDDRRRWVLHEQWRDQAALDSHIADMKLQFGAPPPGARLPQRLHELSESSRGFFYDELTLQ
jgi:quinol monooxygenase YgiN